jgi:hypothetical protein
MSDFKQTTSLERRLAAEAQELREHARTVPAGDAKKSMLRKAREHETALQMTQWLTSSRERPPD